MATGAYNMATGNPIAGAWNLTKGAYQVGSGGLKKIGSAASWIGKKLFSKFGKKDEPSKVSRMKKPVGRVVQSN